MAAGIGLTVVLVFGAIIGTWARRYRRAGPDEVLVISGRRNERRNAAGEIEDVDFRVVRNGGTFVFPTIEEFERMSLHVISTQVATHNAILKEGVPLIVVGTALFKVAGDDTGIINAAKRYLGRPQEHIERDVQAVLEGHLRGVCEQLTPEEIYRDRQAFQEQVADQAQAELTQMVITLDTLTLRDISDEVGYLDELGRRRTTEVSSDARIGEANADREAAIAEAMARQQSERARAEADAQIAEAEKDRDVRKASYAVQNSAAEARAEQAEAEAKQRAAEAKTVLAQRRAEQRREELEAEASKQRDILQAKADAQATVARAEANKQSAVLSGEGNARQISDHGDAESSAIEGKLGAEAKGLGERAEALKQYSDEVIRVQLETDVIAALPETVAAAASPISHVDEIRLIDFGGGHSNGNGSSPVN
jgi:flotillin